MEPTELVLCPLTLRRALFECTPREYREALDTAVAARYRGVSLGMLDRRVAQEAGI